MAIAENASRFRGRLLRAVDQRDVGPEYFGDE
jgi:hypothetical protein